MSEILEHARFFLRRGFEVLEVIEGSGSKKCLSGFLERAGFSQGGGSELFEEEGFGVVRQVRNSWTCTRSLGAG